MESFKETSTNEETENIETNPIAERAFDIDEKIDLMNNGVRNDTASIAAKAMEHEQTTNRIAEIRREFGLADLSADKGLAVTPSGELVEVSRPTEAPIVSPESVQESSLETLEQPEEDKILETELETLEQELRAMPAEEREALVNGDGGDAGTFENGHGGGDGDDDENEHGGGFRTTEELWRFKEVKKDEISFLRLMVELMDGKGFSLKKLAFTEKYLESRRKEIRAELQYRREVEYGAKKE